jgi:hypothetical protein
VEGGGHIFHAKDRDDVFDAGVNRVGHGAGMISRLSGGGGGQRLLRIAIDGADWGSLPWATHCHSPQ